MGEAYGRSPNFKSRFFQNATLDSVSPGDGKDKRLSCKAAVSMKQAMSNHPDKTW